MNTTMIINRAVSIKLLIAISFILITVNGFTQARSQADVSITSVIITPVKQRPSLPANTPAPAQQPGIKPIRTVPVSGDVLKCSITVFSQNDDDANQAMLVVVVPVEVSIVSNPLNATIYKAGGTSPFAGYLVFSLGNMAVGQSITIEFSFTKSVYGNTVGAYAYSASPDPNPANNYKDATY